MTTNEFARLATGDDPSDAPLTTERNAEQETQMIT